MGVSHNTTFNQLINIISEHKLVSVRTTNRMKAPVFCLYNTKDTVTACVFTSQDMHIHDRVC